MKINFCSSADALRAADGIILPGVGAFPDAMQMLQRAGLVQALCEEAEKKPFLGICLGMQLIFEKGYEFEECDGLGLVPGKVRKIEAPGMVIPHMGWNSIHLQNEGRLFKGISQESYVYFVHSYYLKAEEEKIIKATTEYSTHIHASVEKGNLFACQFHPEKSSDLGLAILKNFAEIGEED